MSSLDWTKDISSSLGKPSNGYFNLDYASAPAYVRNFGNDTIYALDFTLNGKDFIYVPKNVVEKGGVQTNEGANLFPWFANSENLKSFGSNAVPVDVSSSWANDYLGKRGLSTNGYLLPADKASFDGSVTVLSKDQLGGDLTGLKNTENGVAFGVSGGHGNRYFTIGDNNYSTFHDPYMSGGSSILGDLTGGLADDLGISSALYSVANPINEFFQTDAGKALLLADLGNSLYNAASSSAATAGSDAMAADNIDIGGGYNPATGAGDASTAAASSATGVTSSAATPHYSDSTELTNQQVLDMIAADQAESMSTADIVAKIEEEQAAAAAAAAATPAQAAAAKAAGMSLIDYAKAGLLVNAIAGDPLGLGGGQPEQAPAGSSGFAQVEIPAEWKSPTYATPSAPIDLESIFSNQNMLANTQWQNLPSQQPNVSFNDIFAAGQQQTPMGTPVDINQIVSSILGQAATSQKPA